MSRLTRIAAASALVLLLGMSFTAGAAAQTTATASVAAIAAVSGIAPLTAAGVNDLNFGAVTAGTPKVPSSLAADAGRYNISGEPSYPVTVSFVLPTTLSGPAAATIPITFGATDGLNWTSYPATFVAFNPNAAFFTSLNGIGTLTIGISGTVSPPLGTTTGTYTGTVSMTVAY